MGTSKELYPAISEMDNNHVLVGAMVRDHSGNIGFIVKKNAVSKMIAVNFGDEIQGFHMDYCNLFYMGS